MAPDSLGARSTLTFPAALVYLNDSSSGLGPGARREFEEGRYFASGYHDEEHVFDSTLESVDAAEAIVLKEAKELGFDEDDEHKIGISVRECMVNAVVHGNRYNSRKKVHLVVTRSPGGAGDPDRRRRRSF